MMTIKELEAKWNSLEAYAGGYLLISQGHPLSFHISYLVGGNKCFVILNTGVIEEIVSSKAISVDSIKMTDGTLAIRFSLEVSSLDELFVKFCWDLVETSRNAEIPLRKIVEQYNNWLKLFQRGGMGLMSPLKQKGLIGELLYLKESILQHGSSVALSAWVGSEQSDQDFVFADYWTEVKAVQISATEVMISSLQQLDRDDDGYLVLYFMDRTANEGQGSISLPNLVEANRELLISPIEKDEYSVKLARYGYYEKDISSYAKTFYRISEKRAYCVTPLFPRLRRMSVPPQVLSAQYSLSLATIDSFKNCGGQV